jgi:hypothetical protein
LPPATSLPASRWGRRRSTAQRTSGAVPFVRSAYCAAHKRRHYSVAKRTRHSSEISSRLAQGDNHVQTEIASKQAVYTGCVENTADRRHCFAVAFCTSIANHHRACAQKRARPLQEASISLEPANVRFSPGAGVRLAIGPGRLAGIIGRFVFHPDKDRLHFICVLLIRSGRRTFAPNHDQQSGKTRKQCTSVLLMVHGRRTTTARPRLGRRRCLLMSRARECAATYLTFLKRRT